MQKNKKLQKRILLEIMTGMGILALTGSIVIFAESMVEELVHEKDQRQNQVITLENDLQALQARLNRFELNAPRYQGLLTKEGQQELDLDREKVKPLLEQIQTFYMLENTKLNLSPVSEMEDASARLPRAVGLVSKGSLNFGAYSDIIAVNLLEGLNESLPGLVRFTQLEMQRGGLQNDAVAVPSMALYSTPKVGVTVQFEWLGIKDPAPKQADNAEGEG